MGIAIVNVSGFFSGSSKTLWRVLKEARFSSRKTEAGKRYRWSKKYGGIAKHYIRGQALYTPTPSPLKIPF